MNTHPSPAFPVRRLLVDLEAPVARRWCGGDAFRTALFNALSMSFPVGEQFFIDAVRNGYCHLSPEGQAAFDPVMRGFVGQEATHRHIHAQFNRHLEQQGLVNAWGPRAQHRSRLLDGSDARHALAITAANEHFTAILAEWLLRHPEVLDDCEPRLKRLWLWHSAEELEHKSAAFDLYLALAGDHTWRVKWFRRTTFIFLTDLARQTVDNLRRDGMLWRWSTWKSAAIQLFGRQGIVTETFRPWRAYLRRDFHPDRRECVTGRRWLAENAGAYTEL